MTYNDLQKEFKNKAYQPIYFLHGNESYYIDKIANHLEKEVLSEDQKAFNLTVLYGKEATHTHIIDAARRYPMMAQHQVVMVKEAQEMKTLKQLEKYVNNPTKSTILVICFKHKKFDKRTKFAKALAKKAVIFESKKLYENKIPDWGSNYLKASGFKLAPNAAELLPEFLGTNLSQIANELDKLKINLPKGTTITVKHIQENIGISKEYNVFELQNALGRKNAEKVFRIVNYFKSNPKKGPLVVIVGSLYNFFSKVYIYHFFKKSSDKEIAQKIGLRSSYFLKDYKAAAKNFPYSKTENVIHLLREYDMKSKGVNRDSTPESELMKELMVKVLSC